MQPVFCIRCHLLVLPSPEGICPGCRKMIPAPLPAQVIPSPTECPECHAMMVPKAVLCIACGYHLERKGFLSTAIDRQFKFSDEDNSDTMFVSVEPLDANPYASPQAQNERPEQATTRIEEFVADLTPFAVKRADGVVSAAERVYWYIFLSFVTCIGAFVVGPIYGYLLLDWYYLNRTYNELRNPTVRRSDHYSLALDFQASKGRIWIGFIGSMIAFVVVLGLMLLRFVTGSKPR